LDLIDKKAPSGAFSFMCYCFLFFILYIYNHNKGEMMSQETRNKSNAIKAVLYDENKIIDAFKKRDCDTLDKIINLGFNVNEPIKRFNDCTLLSQATLNNDLQMADYLTSKGADIKQDPFSLSAATYWGKKEFADKFLDLGAELNCNQKHNALESACQNNQFEMVKYLVEKGANVNIDVIKDKDSTWKNAPLRAATSNADLEMIDYLVEHGAKITQDILFRSAMGDGVAFNHYVGKHNVEISEQTEKNIRAFDLTNAIETIDKIKLRNKLESKLQEKETQSFSMDKPKPSLSKKMKSQGMKL